MSKNYFSVLGLEPGATGEDVKKAYKDLARKFHPDKNKENGAEEKFKDISAAYNILKDDNRREMYSRKAKQTRQNFKTEIRTSDGRIRTVFSTPDGNVYSKTVNKESSHRRRSEPVRVFRCDGENENSGSYSNNRHQRESNERVSVDKTTHKRRSTGNADSPVDKTKTIKVSLRYVIKYRSKVKLNL